MRTLRRRGFLGPAAVLLAAVFFVAQVFACCQANALLGRGLASLFAKTSQPEHACCAKAGLAARRQAANPESSDCARQCCLQQAGQHAPQLASAPSEVPAFSAALVIFAPRPEPAVALGEWPPAVLDSGPPLYLRTLRLLV